MARLHLGESVHFPSCSLAYPIHYLENVMFAYHATGPPLWVYKKLGEFVCIALLMFMLCTGTFAAPLRVTYDSPNLSLKPNGTYLLIDSEEVEDDDFNSS